MTVIHTEPIEVKVKVLKTCKKHKFRRAALRGIMTGVSTASAVVGAAATGFSLGARGNAAVQATLVIMGHK